MRAAPGGVFEANGLRIADLKDLAGYVVNKVTGAYGGEKGRSPATAIAFTASTAGIPAPRPCWKSPANWALPASYCQLATEIEAVLKKKKALALCFNVNGVIGGSCCAT